MLPTLKSVAAGSVSTTTTVVALLLPALVMVTVYVRSVPGNCVPLGFTALATVMVGRMTVTVSFPVSAVAGLSTARALKTSVSFVPDAAIATE